MSPVKVNYYWKGVVLPDENISFVIPKTKFKKIIKDLLNKEFQLKNNSTEFITGVNNLNKKVETINYWVTSENRRVELNLKEGAKLVMENNKGEII